MKAFLLTLITLLVTTSLYGQSWVTDETITEAISSHSGFDDHDEVVIIEFYAEFNKQNAFKDREKLSGVTYYMCDIAKAPQSKKQYKVRMAPTILVFLDGSVVLQYKAGLDLECPVTLAELEKSIAEVQKNPNIKINNTCEKCGKAMTYYAGTKEDGPYLFCHNCSKIIFIYQIEVNSR